MPVWMLYRACYTAWGKFESVWLRIVPPVVEATFSAMN